MMRNSIAGRDIRIPALVMLLAGGAGAAAGPLNHPPHFVRGEIQQAFYDGVTDDLLTAGLGKDGLAGAAPAIADPLSPTAAELRRLAIYNNYRALVDMSAGGGYGRFYGPNILPDGTDTGGQGLIAGHEFLAFAGPGSGHENVTLMVQVPASFDPADPCIVTAPSSGSRGVYGAIGTAGDWGLKQGCAVAYTDKGTGTGAHDLQNDTVYLIDGTRADADSAGKSSTFTAGLSDAQREAFNAATPDRFAFKHAHSRQNPEQDWGKNVMQSIELAFFVLNQLHGEPTQSGKKRVAITPDNTLVIASSVSNGAGASLRAAEQDYRGLIDGIAVSEPNVNPQFSPDFSIVQGSGAPLAEHSRSLYDYTTLLTVFQGCANRAPGNAGAPFNFVPAALGENVCTSLRENGLLQADTLAEQATEAQQIINAFGILPEQNLVQPSHWFLNVPQAIGVTYANAYGRTSVLRNLCGFGFGANDGVGMPAPLVGAAAASLFGTSNGIPPTGGVELIYNDSLGGPLMYRNATSPSSGRMDQALDGLLCLRALATGLDPVIGERLRGMDRGHSARVRMGIAQVRAGGDLHGKPAVIVTGRNDAILPPNHASRAYYGLNQVVEGASQLRYYEITNAQHLDVLNAFAGFNDKFVPLHHYFIQALNLMHDHLKNGTPLPPSQVVHTVPRGMIAGGVVPDLTEANVPPIAADPPQADRITFTEDQLQIPE
jgi:hydroxybutyrate-dimer hydrolase